jgi:hypothetical protein
MKKFKMIFTEKELDLLDGLCKHCLKNKDRFIMNNFSNTEVGVESLLMLEDFVLKIKNAIEV